jgi:hypothetical protein
MLSLDKRLTCRTGEVGIDNLFRVRVKVYEHAEYVLPSVDGVPLRACTKWLQIDQYMVHKGLQINQYRVHGIVTNQSIQSARIVTYQSIQSARIVTNQLIQNARIVTNPSIHGAPIGQINQYRVGDN